MPGRPLSPKFLAMIGKFLILKPIFVLNLLVFAYFHFFKSTKICMTFLVCNAGQKRQYQTIQWTGINSKCAFWFVCSWYFNKIFLIWNIPCTKKGLKFALVLNHSTKIAKGLSLGLMITDQLEYPSVQINSSSPCLIYWYLLWLEKIVLLEKYC